MSHDEPRPLSSTEEQEMRTAIRGLADVRPGVSFRASLKESFVAGTIEPRPVPGARMRMRPARWGWALAAAAVIAGLVLLRVGTSNVPWTLEDVSGTGSLVLDGEPFPIDDVPRLESALSGGGRIQIPPDASILLATGEGLRMELTAGLEATLPGSPRRWLAQALELEVHAGELRVSTGPSLPGARLQVRTPDGLIEVTGTVFSVVCDEGVTCVCVLEGKIRVGRTPSDMDEVPAGMRKVMFRDGRPPLLTESAPEHREGLEGFQSRLGRSAPAN